MTTWQQTPGFIPGQQDPQQPYYGQPGYPAYPPQIGYPQQLGYPQQPGYPPEGFTQQPGYPPQPSYPPQGYPNPPPTYTPGGFVPPPQNQLPPPAQAMYGSYTEDPLTADNADNFAFSEKTIRHGFIRKVYGILMCQLALTTGVIALFLYNKSTKEYVRAHPEIFWISFVAVIITLIAMSCFTNVRRKAPMNFIFLGIFTVAESLLLGFAASTYDTESVLMAAGITTAVCLGLSIFAFQTKWDFTVMGSFLFIAVIILIIFGIIAMIFPGKTIILIYASLGALLFSLYLVYDTQLMIGGKHKYSISPEEYIFAALNLYLDVVNIFIYILTIIGVARD